MNDNTLEIGQLLDHWCHTDQTQRRDETIIVLFQCFMNHDLYPLDKPDGDSTFNCIDFLYRFVRNKDLSPFTSFESAEGAIEHGIDNPLVFPQERDPLTPEILKSATKRLCEIFEWETKHGEEHPYLREWFYSFFIRKTDFQELCIRREWRLPDFWFSDGERRSSQGCTAKREAEARHFLRTEGFPDPSRTKETLRDYVIKRFRISGKAFDRLWKDIAPPERRKAGRPKDSIRRRRDSPT